MQEDLKPPKTVRHFKTGLTNVCSREEKEQCNIREEEREAKGIIGAENTEVRLGL